MSVEPIKRSEENTGQIPYGQCSDCGRVFQTSYDSFTNRGGKICRDRRGCSNRSAEAYQRTVTTKPHQDAPVTCASCGREFTTLSEFTYVLREKVCRDNDGCITKVLDVAEGRAVR